MASNHSFCDFGTAASLLGLGANDTGKPSSSPSAGGTALTATSTDPRPAPSLAQYYDAANAVYDDNSNGKLSIVSDAPASTGLELLLDSRSPSLGGGSAWLADGFFAQAFLNKAGDVIVAFEGTLTSDVNAYAAGSLAADAEITKGIVPEAFRLAETFVADVEKHLKAIGDAADPIYLTGHSLGGAEAEYVASTGHESGVTFGAPGDLHPTYGALAAGQSFTDYVDYGDPVGNFGYHFGTETHVGSPADATETARLARLLGPAGTALAAEMYHPLTHYAADLGLQLENGWATPPAGSKIA